jgi:hypothetical protein
MTEAQKDILKAVIDRSPKMDLSTDYTLGHVTFAWNNVADRELFIGVMNDIDNKLDIRRTTLSWMPAAKVFIEPRMTTELMLRILFEES